MMQLWHFVIIITDNLDVWKLYELSVWTIKMSKWISTFMFESF